MDAGQAGEGLLAKFEPVSQISTLQRPSYKKSLSMNIVYHSNVRLTAYSTAARYFIRNILSLKGHLEATESFQSVHIRELGKIDHIHHSNT